jgi:hypothetical protein
MELNGCTSPAENESNFKDTFFKARLFPSMSHAKNLGGGLILMGIKICLKISLEICEISNRFKRCLEKMSFFVHLSLCVGRLSPLKIFSQVGGDTLGPPTTTNPLNLNLIPLTD